MQIISNEIVRIILTRIEKVTYNKRKLVAVSYLYSCAISNLNQKAGRGVKDGYLFESG